MGLKTILIDARTHEDVWNDFIEDMAKAKVVGIDCETEDSNNHAGLKAYNNKTRHVFDHRRTVMTGFSLYSEGSDYAYYFNLNHADEINRLPKESVARILKLIPETAILIAHNAPYELVMFEQCYGIELTNIVCTLQMAVSHHGPDEYDLQKFYDAPLPASFMKFAKDITENFMSVEGGKLGDKQKELLSKFIAKESKADHSYNGLVASVAMGYSLKALTKSTFGVSQQTYDEVLNGREHMGQLTGEEVASYGADDSYWAVRHFRHMLDDMMKNNPKALNAFFQTENQMVHLYADAWRDGIRLDLKQVFERRDIERIEMAKLLRSLKAKIKEALPFPAEAHPQLLKREKWYFDPEKKTEGWKKKRQQIEAWAKTPDDADDFKQCIQVSNPIGNAWSEETGVVQPKGKMNIIHYMTMRTIMYDLVRAPIQIDGGSVASDAAARGRIREKLPEGVGLDIMEILQQMAEVEQRMKLYLTPYTQLMDPETSRVYPSLSSKLATRRLATSFPNPMQLAKSGNSAYIRSFYLGDTDEHVVVSADWSAIELVLIGDQSGDPGFAKIYGTIPYGDMHSGAAVDALSVKTLPGLTEEEFREFKFGRNPNGRVLRDYSGNITTPSDYYKWARGTAVGKGVNFSYWYSGALSTVATNLGWSDDEHWEAVDKYRERFPVAEAYRVGLQQTATEFGFVTLPDGHRRNRFECMPEWRRVMTHKFAEVTAASGFMNYAEIASKRIQGRARNQVVNAVIQGTCATLAKRTLLNLKKLCSDAGLQWGFAKDYRLMMPIHDELVFSVHKSVVMQFLPLLRQAMTTHPEIVKNLPLHCTVAIGRTFRPFNKADPRLSQIELDEAQCIEGVIGKDLEGQPLPEDKVQAILDYMFEEKTICV